MSGIRGKQVLIAPLPYVVRQLILIQRSRQQGLQLCHPQEVWAPCSPSISTEVTAEQDLGAFALVLQMRTFIQTGGNMFDFVGNVCTACDIH